MAGELERKLGELERMQEVHHRIHDAVYGTLIDKIRDDRYPSSTMMNMVEQGMRGDEVEAYADALLDKVTSDRFPSIDMINRLLRMA